MRKKIFVLLLFFVSLIGISHLIYAEDQTVFGPEDFKISSWHIHLSQHAFDIESPGDGYISISKNTPEEDIKGGILIFNWQVIPLGHFVKGDDLNFSKDVKLKNRNQLIVLLEGTPRASINIEIRSKNNTTPPPEITFSANSESIIKGESCTLSWEISNADAITIDNGIGSVSSSGSTVVTPQETTTYTITATGSGGIATDSLTVTVYQPPTVSINADPGSILLGESSTLSWLTTNADSVSIDQGLGTVSVNGATSVSPALTTTYTITVTGPGGTTTDSVTVDVSNPTDPPEVNINASPSTIALGGTATIIWSSSRAQDAFIDNGIGSVQVNGSITVNPEHTTTYTITVTGSTGSASAQAVVVVAGNPEPQQEGSFGSMYKDLIPSDATVDKYDAKRFSLITGQVYDIDNLPVSGVSITIHGYPEYGTVHTDNDGKFSIPVEGGSTITVIYKKQGYISSQRKVYVPWNDIAVVETVQMVSEDLVSTYIEFDGNPDTVITHESTEITDDFGSRSCTMVFTGDNQAYLTDENANDIQALSAITARATEFTTPESMPAKLPPNSAYTYCVELTVDSAAHVRFKKPVITWVNNFLGFNVGEIVPVGYYDRDKGVWVPSDNGVVVRLLDTNSDGIVDALDADGDNLPDDLDGNGSFTNEVTGLGDSSKYQPGSTFWRISVSHFTPWDYNWPYGPPLDAIPPNPKEIPDADQQQEEAKDCTNSNASYVEERSRIFHEDIPIPGTGISLHYSSNRVKGYKTDISVPASGDSVPGSLNLIRVKVEAAGRVFEKILDPIPNQTAEFIWDGTDYLGKKLETPIDANISVGFVYNLVYQSVENFAQAFAKAGGETTGIRGRQDITSWKKSTIKVYPVKTMSRGEIGEGWTLSNHHSLFINDLSTLYRGDGSIYHENNNKSLNLIDTVAGDGREAYSGDGGPANEAAIRNPTDVDIDAIGNLFIVDRWSHVIRKVDTNGIISTIAGNGTPGYSGDGGLATNAQLNNPWGIDVDDFGNIYITDWGNNVIRKIDTNGIISTIAGTGTSGYSGDDGPATEAQIHARNIFVDNEGNIYFTDDVNNVVRKINTNGIITSIAGNGTRGYSGDEGPATEAELNQPWDVVGDMYGNIFISDYSNSRIRKVDISGKITTFTGSFYPQNICLDTDGNLYVSRLYHGIQLYDGYGNSREVAGFNGMGYSGDGGLAIDAQLSYPYGIALNPSGHLFIADSSNHRVRKVAPDYAFSDIMTTGDFLFRDENGLGYIMSNAGRHKKTIDLNTGVISEDFGYNEEKAISSIMDHFGNQTIIERDINGIPTAIISPDGVTTELAIDENNHLTRITYPDGSHYDFEYTSDGLLTAKIEPEGNRFEHQFDSNGRLTDATDDEGGHWHYTRTSLESGDILTKILTGENNLTTYLDHTFSTGEYTSTITDPTGAQTLFTQSSDGLTVNKSISCGMDLQFHYDVDSEYKFKVLKEMKEITPSDLERVTSRNKTYEDTDSDGQYDLITETVSLNGKATSIEQNTLAAIKTVTSPEGRTIITQYDPDNLLALKSSVPGLFETSYGYDSRGRLNSIVTNTRETSLIYNTKGFLESITDPEDNTTSFSHDPVGRVTEILRPDNSSIGFIYDRNGNMTVLSNPSLIDHEFGFNSVNMNNSYLTPLSGTYQYIYDKDRRLIEKKFPSGNDISYIYNNSQLTQIQTPEGNIDLTYLCSTKVGSITNRTESISYDYDGKLTSSETFSGILNKTINYAYNNDFNISSFTYAGYTEAITYDNDGLLTGVGGYAISRNAGNGLPEGVNGRALNLTRVFNGYGEVGSQGYTINSQPVTSWNLSRDNNGRIISKTETVDNVTANYSYTYDPMGRLRTVTKDNVLVEEYRYNANGARIYEMNSLRGIAERGSAYSDEDHLLTAGAVKYEYDHDGFLTTKTDGSEVTTYDYSARGELLHVDLPDGTVEYVYDPLGRRIAKKVNGTVLEKYLWEGMTTLLAVYDGSDNLLMRFEYADGRMPVSMTRSDGRYYLTYDHVGSLRAVSDASGNVVKSVEYDSFGNIINDNNPSFMIPFGFAGGLYDQDTGLVRFGYRDYDPDVGRWTAKDPILFDGEDTDLFGYCLNDPVNSIDFVGLLTSGENFFIGAVGTTVSIIASVTPVAPFASALGGLSAGLLTVVMGGDVNEAIWNGMTSAWGGGLFNWALKTMIPKVIVTGFMGEYGLDLLWAATAPPWELDGSPCH